MLATLVRTADWITQWRKVEEESQSHPEYIRALKDVVHLMETEHHQSLTVLVQGLDTSAKEELRQALIPEHTWPAPPRSVSPPASID